MRPPPGGEPRRARAVGRWVGGCHIHDNISHMGRGHNAKTAHEGKVLWTDGWMDLLTDRVTYRVTCTHLKIMKAKASLTIYCLEIALEVPNLFFWGHFVLPKSGTT